MAVAGADPAHMLRDLGLLIGAFCAYYLVVRPLILGMNTAAASIRLEPNLFPLILSRLHRWTIGQAVTFFDNDFAGRIAQKQMQTARATTDVVASLIETAAFAISSVVGSVLLLMTIDYRIALVLILWIADLLRVHPPLVKADQGRVGGTGCGAGDGHGADRRYRVQHENG